MIFFSKSPIGIAFNRSVNDVSAGNSVTMTQENKLNITEISCRSDIGGGPEQLFIGTN